jgi:hypothetical protein
MAGKHREIGPWGLAVAACLALAGVLSGAPARNGKATCVTCHRAEAEAQPKTAMGIGLELPPDQAPLRKHAKLTLDSNGYHYEINRTDGESIYSVSDGSGSLTLPIRYALGVHNLTFVLEYQGKFYESLATYYQKPDALGITMGDEKMRPHNLTEAMGRLNSEQEIMSCFNCHGTGGVNQGKLSLATLKPGLNCEHCHTGADAHQQGMAAGKTAPAPRKLGEMAAEEMSNFCGQCHRTWASVVGLRLFGQKNVRFQPYRLANSQCFLGDDKRIRCTACHNPHVDLVREDAYYDRACLACHNLKTQAAVASAARKTCPVADKNCVTCHMPKVQVPGSPAIFTDHDIRVVHAGDSYPQ